RSGSLSAHHIGDDLLSPYRIADADDGGIGHTRVPGNALLDLHGVDVLPSRDDHVVLAAEAGDESVLVPGRAVTGIEPAVVALLRLDLGQIHVLEPGLRAAHDHFAGCGAVLIHRLVGGGTSVVQELDHSDIVIGARPAR